MAFNQYINTYLGCKARNKNFGQNKTSWKFFPNVPKLVTFAKKWKFFRLLPKSGKPEDIILFRQCLMFYEPGTGAIYVTKTGGGICRSFIISCFEFHLQ
jgi:hypothetical protein